MFNEARGLMLHLLSICWLSILACSASIHTSYGLLDVPVLAEYSRLLTLDFPYPVFEGHYFRCFPNNLLDYSRAQNNIHL